MPTISRFYGITIQMFFKEHGVPHFHARYGGRIAVFTVEALERIRVSSQRGPTGSSASGLACIEPS